ncbi:MAG: sulfite exporter TauE/SafE family protein [Rhizobiales bacterium]|nr:sulfite exporter TauE/SafE family protein [Hyphomicrobiales bacterium]
MFDSSTVVAVAICAFLVAGVVKGVIGMGLPAVGIAILSLVMSPAQGAALLVVPSLATNVWQFLAGPHVMTLLRRLWSMMLGICAGVWAGSGFLANDTTGRARTALGVVLMFYAAYGLANRRYFVPTRAEPWLSPLIGFATGLVSAATGIFAMPSVPYLQAMALEKEDLVQALGLTFTVATVALGVDLLHGGVLQASVALPSLLALGIASLGMFVGQTVRMHVVPGVFRVCFFIGMLFIGAHLALRGLI